MSIFDIRMNKKYEKMCAILFKIYSFVFEKAAKQTLKLDMAKQAGRVGFGLGQSGYGSNGSRVESGRVDP